MNNETIMAIAFLIGSIAVAILLIMIIITFFTKMRPVFKNKKTIEEIKKNKLDLVDLYMYKQLCADNTLKGFVHFIGVFDHLLTEDEAIEYLKENPYDSLVMIYKVDKKAYIYDMDESKWFLIEGDTTLTDTTYDVVGPYLEKTETIPLEDIDQLINECHVEND